MSDNTPPIFSDRSLRIATKIVAIYAVFYLTVAIVPLLLEPTNELLPENHAAPTYFNAAIHLLMFIAALISILKDAYSWLITGVCIVLIIGSRFFYREIAEWVWTWTS